MQDYWFYADSDTYDIALLAEWVSGSPYLLNIKVKSVFHVYK